MRYRIDMRFLGETVPFPSAYNPSLLEGVPRAIGRDALGIGSPLPFTGEDIWNGYELTWIEREPKRPRNGFFRLSVPVTSERLVESKSLKLYLGSLTNEEFEDSNHVARQIHADLGAVLGTCDHAVIIADEPIDESPCNYTYRSELLRSICPITAQPDFGTLYVRVDQASSFDAEFLDRLVMTHRNLSGFHEQCCEQFFLEIVSRFNPTDLAVGCFYTRRGGIDINPLRRLPTTAANFLTYWRQPRQ